MKLIYDPNLTYIVIYAPAFPHLVGEECSVTTHSVEYGDGQIGQETDIPDPKYPGKFLYASKGNLRPKDVPPGEKMIHEIIEGKINVMNEENV